MKHEPVILIADSKEVFDEMESVLGEELGTTQIIHVDNRDAAESIIDSGIRFDIIFVDWQLVGAKFVDAVRSDSKNGCTPLVVMSELDTDIVIATATRHGASGFLAKPFLTKGLINKINHVMARQDRRRKKRLCPDHTINVTIDIDRAGAIEGNLIDFSIDYCHIRFDLPHREELIIGDSAMVHLNIDTFRVDLESRLVRVEEDKERANDAILILYKFNNKHAERVEKLEELLDEYQSKW